MKRQRIANDMSGGYGYGSYDLPPQADGVRNFGLMDSGSPMPIHSGNMQPSGLQYGMRPGPQSDTQASLGGMPEYHQGEGLSNLPRNGNGTYSGNEYGSVGMDMSSQLMQGSGMAANMGQSHRQNIGHLGGQDLANDLKTNMVQNMGSGMGRNFDQTMGSNRMVGAKVGSSMGMGTQNELSQSLGQGLGISEGFPCVKLRGLPFDANEQDIAVWLETEPLDIIIVRRAQRSTGEAFILLRMPVQVDMVLEKNKSYIGKRYVEVALAKKLDFYRAVHAMVQDDLDSKSSSMSLERRQRDEGRHAHTYSPPRRRYNSRHSSRDVFPSKHRNYEANGSDDYEDHLLPSQRIHTGVLKMRGLPFAATPEDIVYWFNSAGLPIDPITSQSVHIVISSGGKPTGNGYVRFASPEESKAAMAKDRKSLGSRYIELFPCKPDEMPEMW